MNFRQMTDVQIGLILLGLRAIYVADNEEQRLKMIEDCEGALAARGKRLGDNPRAEARLPHRVTAAIQETDHQVDFQYHRIGRDWPSASAPPSRGADS